MADNPPLSVLATASETLGWTVLRAKRPMSP